MSSLAPNQVVRGDILIHKSFALGMNWRHAMIRAGQFLTGSPIHSNSVHASIAVGGGDDEVRIVESTGKGVNDAVCESEADVFRLVQSGPLPDRAAGVAERLLDRTHDRKTSGGKPAGHYNMWRSAFSVIRPEYYDKKAGTLIDNVGKALANGSDYGDGFFCSMLVVICYDVAGQELKLPSPPILKDPMNLNPSNLQAYLLDHPDVWQLVGTVNEAKDWIDRIFSIESGE